MSFYIRAKDTTRCVMVETHIGKNGNVTRNANDKMLFATEDEAILFMSKNLPDGDGFEYQAVEA
jgi:hypothetical protein